MTTAVPQSTISVSLADFDIATAETSTIMEAYGVLFKQNKDAAQGKCDPLDENQVALLEVFEEQLNQRLKLVIVTPEDTDLIEQLLNQDPIHEFGNTSVEDLTKYRLGDEDSNKRIVALIHDNDGKREILSAINVFQAVEPRYKAITHEDELPNYIEDIVHSKVGPVQGRVRAQVFFSVYTMKKMRGAGEMLIQRLYADLNKKLSRDVIFTTLSPFPTYESREIKIEHDDSLDDDAKKAATQAAVEEDAIVQLVTGKDGTRNLHLGLGAKGGRVTVVPETGKAWVNYPYVRDSDVTAWQAKEFRDNGTLFIAEGMYEKLPLEVRLGDARNRPSAQPALAA